MFEPLTFPYVFRADRLRTCSALLAMLALTTACAEEDKPLAPDVVVDRYALDASSIPSREWPGWRPPAKVLVISAPKSVVADLERVAPDSEIIARGWDFDDGADYSDVDVVIGPCNRRVLENVPSARWIHSLAAGVDGCATSDRVRNGVTAVTNSARIFGPQVADHAMALTLALTRNLGPAMEAQRDGEWRRDGLNLLELQGKTMLIAGLGGIGEAIAQRAKAFGMRVTATRNSSREGPPTVDYVGLADELPTLAAEADVVVNVLPLTPQTTALYDADFFRGMPSHAFFVNVGRGKSVVTGDLIAALRKGDIAGAGLDVTEPEPLPRAHALWQAPNVIITPHTGGGSDGSQRRRWAVVQENLRRYVAGEPLLNLVDPAKAY